MLNSGQNGRFFAPCDLKIWWITLNKANLRDLIAATGIVILLKLDSNHQFFSPCDLEIWWMTPKNNLAPLLCYFKLFASFRSHWWIQTGVTVWKRQIWWFFSRVTLKFDWWPWKTIGNLFYPISSFVHHFIPIGEFKLELQPRNAQFGSKLTIFLAAWPSNFLSYFKLCASFHTHWWIQTGVTAQKRPIWVKIDDFFSRVTFKLNKWYWKTIGHLFNAISSFVHHFVPIGEFKLESQSGNAQFGSNFTILRAVWPWNLTNDLEKQ